MKKIERAAYALQSNGDFVIANYNESRPFSSFFPGIAGLFGIPLWVFTVNRGQCIASIGVRSKDEAIMEFLPANKAYQMVSSQGFRTFVKTSGNKRPPYYEPFRSDACLDAVRPSGKAALPARNKMIVRSHELEIEERNPTLGLCIRVVYFPVPSRPYAALARLVHIENIARADVDLEVLDGVCAIVPYGVNNFFLKEMSRTIEAWMTVQNLEKGVPLFKVMTDPRDTAQVVFVKGGHFYATFGESQARPLSDIIVDPQVIFGSACDFSAPLAFAGASSFAYPKKQVTMNKTPCAFSYLRKHLRRGETLRFFSLLGHVFDDGDIEKFGIGRTGWEALEQKRAENKALIDGIQDRIFTASGVPAFDFYARQTYLDNVLRGGLSYAMQSSGGRRSSVYVFSRKHGDLERDYNRFFVSASYFSEGEGNYRDVNQNRRSDIFFNPSLGDKNIVDFMNLIQLDGYNPLIFRGDRFVVDPENFKKTLGVCFCEKERLRMSHVFTRPFVLGEALRQWEENKASAGTTPQEFLARLLGAASVCVESAHGEGFWTDHWTYNTDLIESFCAVYPEKTTELLFERNDFIYHDTHVFVRPRAERYSLHHGEVRQYHSLFHDEAKNALLQKRMTARHAVRTSDGQGEVYRTTLFDKFICLIANKLSTLDPEGAGVEMEAEKPNWYDALNGLPGLLGSSISETFELKRVILLLKSLCSEKTAQGSPEVTLTAEVGDFMEALHLLLAQRLSAFDYWNRSNAVKEEFRLKVRGGVSGQKKKIPLSDVLEFFDLALQKLEQGIAKGFDVKTGKVTSYFFYKVRRYETAAEASGKSVIIPQEFQQASLPPFLEGFVHAMRTEKEHARLIRGAVVRGPLFDKKLKMVKVNASLKKESFEIGRAKAFPSGWLENESVWLHMEYKYLLELLKNGLFEEFYDDFFRVLIPFQNPRRYGRSILENSSFIASSVHPDRTLHGAGFVARLSGSTAEFIHMWVLMNIGGEPFFLDENRRLCLRFSPALPGRFFARRPSGKNYTELFGLSRPMEFPGRTYSFLFLGQTFVTYLNPGGKNTFGRGGARPREIVLFDEKGEVARYKGNVVGAPHAQMLRDGRIRRAEILLG